MLMSKTTNFVSKRVELSNGYYQIHLIHYEEKTAELGKEKVCLNKYTDPFE